MTYTSLAAIQNEEEPTSGYTIHTVESAPEGSREALAKAQGHYGFIPNLLGVLAEAPAAVNGYVTLSGIFAESSLSPVEQQVVVLSISVENGCDYCVAAHSGAARMAEVPEYVLAALREGGPLPDPKLEALSVFTKLVVINRGKLAESQVQDFIAAGYSKAQVLEVITAVAVKTISNYANHIADTPLDGALESLRWSPPQNLQAVSCC